MELDNYNKLISTGINIYGSREKIRSNMIDFAKKYLELESVDFYKTSVISYLVDILSILTANQLFYDSIIYREFFMVEAQMQESVYNLARWIGYNVPKAIPSKVDLLFTLPLTFNSSFVSFTMPNNFKAYSNNNLTFTIDSVNISQAAATFEFDKEKFQKIPAATGRIINNSAITVRDSNGYLRPIFISQDGKYASFSLPFTQHKKQVFQFLISDEIQPYQFFSKVLNYDGMVSDIKVWIVEPNFGEKIMVDSSNSDDFNPDEEIQSYIAGRDGSWYPWKEWKESEHGVYTMAPNSEQFVFVPGIDRGELFFGNGIIGKQPAKNSLVTVEIYTTSGEEGHVIPNTITRGDKLYYSTTPRYTEDGPEESGSSKVQMINYSIMNPIHSKGGTNAPTLPEIKQNAIINLRSKGKLVSELDYDDINIIMGPNFPTVETYPLLKRSDIKINEIMAFILLTYHDENYLPQIVPTRNVKFELIDPQFDSSGRYTLIRTSEIEIDGETFETIFNITIDNNTMMGYYDYISKNIFGSPVVLYSGENMVQSVYQQYSYLPITGVDFDVDIDKTYLNESSSSSEDQKSYPVKIKVHVNHLPQSVDSDWRIEEYRCKMITKWDDHKEYEEIYAKYTEENEDKKYEYFEFEISNYLDVPSETQRFEFIIEGLAIRRDNQGRIIDEHGNVINPSEQDIEDNPEQFITWQPISKYFTDVLIRKDLTEVMSSTITKENYWDGEWHDYYKWYIHNVPTILSKYLDDGDGGGVLNRADNQQNQNFEITVVQSLLRNLELGDRRMLTDFVNIKFPDTYGTLNNLKYNPIKDIVRSRFKTPFKMEHPDNIIWNPKYDEYSSSSGMQISQKYIVNGPVPNYEAANKNLSSYINFIAEHYDGIGWYLIKPFKGMYVRVQDELDNAGDEKIIVFDGDKWIDAQQFKIPLNIDLKIELDKHSTMSDSQAKDMVINALLDHFSPHMGIHKHLDRSEIVTVVRKIPGIVFCELKQPEVDIVFDYDIKDLTQYQLLDYTPQYVGFNEHTIEVEVIH